MRIFAAILVAAAVMPLAANEKKLVAYWNFNEGEGDKVADVSGSGYDGKILNDMRGVKWVDGRKGKALEFTGTRSGNQSGAVSVPGFNVDYSQGLTVELWMKMADSADWKKGMFHMLCNASGNHGPGFNFYYYWRRIAFTSGEGQGKSWTASAPVSDLTGQWVHLAVTYEDSKCRIYINGGLAGETAEPVVYVGKKSSTLTIGSGWSGASYGFQGILDEIKVYNYALTATEIVRHAKLDM